jgi:hypothetical protein
VQQILRVEILLGDQVQKKFLMTSQQFRRQIDYKVSSFVQRKCVIFQKVFLTNVVGDKRPLIP